MGRHFSASDANFAVIFIQGDFANKDTLWRFEVSEQGYAVFSACQALHDLSLA